MLDPKMQAAADAVAGMNGASASGATPPLVAPPKPESFKPTIAATSTAAAMQSIGGIRGHDPIAGARPPTATGVERDRDRVPGRAGDTIPNSSAGNSGHVPGGPQLASEPKGNGNGGGVMSPPGSGPGGGDPFKYAAPKGHAKKVSEVLGEIVWLMSQSPLHKQFFISDLEWFVMTPVLLQQFRLFYAKDRPMGVVLWGSVNDEVAARLEAGVTKLRPQDWKSGDQLWAIEVMAPFGGAEEMIKDLKTHVFPNREIRYVAVTKDGKKESRVV